MATRGTETGNAAPALTITSGTNDALDVVVDGISANVTIPAGSYTATSLAAAVQAAINGSTAITNAGSSVNVAVNSSGALAITSQRYGSAHSQSGWRCRNRFIGFDAHAGHRTRRQAR